MNWVIDEEDFYVAHLMYKKRKTRCKSDKWRGMREKRGEGGESKIFQIIACVGGRERKNKMIFFSV